MNAGFKSATGIKNFLFHRVHPQRDRLWDPMDVALFEKCIRYITRHYSVGLVENFVQQEITVTSGRRYASIVFDDGYKDNIEYALPVLEKYGAKASFYVVTDCIDNNIPTWTYILDYLFQHTKRTQIQLCFPFLIASLHVTSLASAEERVIYVRKLKPQLKKLPHDERQVVLDAVRLAFDDVEIPRMMMNWDEVRQLSTAGHVIGSHTVTHSMLGTIKDEEEVAWELQHSGFRIREKLGFFPSTISYPVGSYHTTTMKLAREAGYKLGLAVNQLAYQPAVHDRFEVPRIELYNESWLKTRCRMSNTYRKIVKLLKPS